MSGTLYGVGVGPGDPELVTLKALRILREAQVLAWPAPEEGPSLAREIVADHLPGGQREIAIRMPLSPARFPADDVYDNAAAEISAALSEGDDVAVICEGDPFFYGSFMYLFGRLAADHPVEVIPGVSSLTACAAALGAPASTARWKPSKMRRFASWIFAVSSSVGARPLIPNIFSNDPR